MSSEHGRGGEEPPVQGSADPLENSHEQIPRMVREWEIQRSRLEAENEKLRETQRQLEQYRDRYIDLYDSAPLGYFTLDEDGYVQEVNLAGAKLIGADRNDLIGYPFLDYVVEADRLSFGEHVLRCGHSREEAKSEVTLQTKDGRQIVVLLHSIPLEKEKEDDDQDVALCKMAVTDMTERKQIEEQLRDLNRTLEQRVARRTADVEEQVRRLQHVASQWSQSEHHERHRLVQVLENRLQQFLITARDGLSGLEQRLDDVSLKRALAEIETLLERSVAESCSLAAELSPPLLHDSGLAAALHWLAEKMREIHGLTVDVDADPQADPADEGVRVFLFEAVRELLLNVVNHAGTDRAEVVMRRTGEFQARIEVQDAGKGFDPAKLDSSRTMTEGSGLPTIRHRLDLLGGRLEMTSSPDHGTRAALVAPIGKARSPVDHAAKIRVLLADDHPIVRKGLVELLREHTEIELVAEAGDGQEAVERARELRPDVVILDVSMPKLSGTEAAQRIRAELPQTRIVGLSMHESAGMAETMIAAGAHAYVSKDAPSEELIAAVLGG